MPQRAAELGLAVAALVQAPLSERQVTRIGFTALRCSAPKLLEVLALRATSGRMLRSEVEEHLDAVGRWPDGALADPIAALVLALQWAVGGETVRDQPRARRAFEDILKTCGPKAFAHVDRSAQVFVQLPWLAGDTGAVRRLMATLPLSARSIADLESDLANPFARQQSGTPEGIAQWLHLFNRRFRAAGLAPVTLADHEGVPFDRLSAASGPSVDGPLVTVIVPSFAPDAGLLNSIRSMAAQTYGPLEILLVDDASGPAFTALYDEAAAIDPRVRIVRMPVNGGSYLGRNAALAQATGALVTTQDADDWSHPERIAHQVALLQAHPMAPASRSDAIRALDDLSLQWLGYDSQRPNASSLMVRRTAVEALGGFDTVRKGADSEMHERLTRRLGPTLDTSTPLAITRLRAGSLSRSDFRLHWMAPDRVLYRTSYRDFHDSMRPGRAPITPTTQVRKRAFPAPRSYQRALPGAATLPQRYDVVYLLDLSLPSALSEPGRDALIPEGLRIALVHQEHPGAGPRPAPKVFTNAVRLGVAGRVDLISATDPVVADTLVVLTPGLLELPSMDEPHVRARHTAVVLSTVSGEPVDLFAVRAGAREVFGGEIEFVGRTAEEASDWAMVSGEPTRSLPELLATLAPAGEVLPAGTGEQLATAQPEGPVADKPAPDTPVGPVVVLGERALDLQHVAGLWAEQHPRARMIAVHAAKSLAGLPRNVHAVSVRGSIVIDSELAGPKVKRLASALTKHPPVAKEVERASLIVVPDALAREVRARLSTPTRPVQSWSDFVAETRSGQALRLVHGCASAAGRGPAAVAVITEALDVAAPSPQLYAAVAHALSRLLRNRDTEAVVALEPTIRRLPQTVRDAHGLDALVRTALITQGGAPEPGDARAARTCFDEAERLTTSGEVDAVPLLVAAGLRLIFNRELHTDGERSVLIDDPSGQLAPWRESAFAARIYGCLAQRHHSEAPDPEAPQQTPTADPGATVFVLRGAYGDFAAPVVDLLRGAGLDPTVVLPEELGPYFTRQLADEALIAQWLRLVDPETFAGLPVDPTLARAVEAFAERIRSATTVFADWCDPGAAFASLLLPPGARLVIRMHRLDAVRVWPQLTDWSAVAALIVVSEHVRAMVARQIVRPDASEPTRIVVLNNVIDVARYRRAKTPGAHRRLAMVGWGRQVKDPIFALEILRELLAHDPDWELHLIGRDFPAHGSPAVLDYTRRFRDLATSSALRDHIRYIGFTTRLEEALDECGFALSTSRVEGWPVGVVEAAASGAIPVIRDWPQVAALGGARVIYADQPDWVMSTPAQAAARITAYAEPQAWAAESQRVRAAADTLCAVGATSDEYLDVILGTNRR